MEISHLHLHFLQVMWLVRSIKSEIRVAQPIRDA
jgi:hypothetical protein